MTGIIGITRVRNESLILEDTLRHVLDRVQGVILYDDASTDDTVEIARSFDRVHVIEGRDWLPDRPAEETRHRRMLTSIAQNQGAAWVWCFDADERMAGPMPPLPFQVAGIVLPLFDGYMAHGFDQPYRSGPLIDLPRLWGAERRDILMIFRPELSIWSNPDQRQPVMQPGSHVMVAPDTPIKHFGKCLSVEHWEDTCNYYATHWGPSYRDKWAARRGKAIHTVSDKGGPLFLWDDLPKGCPTCGFPQDMIASSMALPDKAFALMRCRQCGLDVAARAVFGSC